MDTQINVDSPINQRIKGKLVGKEVHACITQLVEYVLQTGFERPQEAPFLLEDIQNLCQPVCPECGGTEITESAYKNNVYICDSCEYEGFGQDMDQQQQDIYEWWLVDRMLLEDLKKRGEPVIEAGQYQIWGRTCTGQAIQLDHVISEIALDMEILEGQKNSWADHVK